MEVFLVQTLVQRKLAAFTVGSEDVFLGVIDTGVDYTHPDLVDSMWVNPGEIPSDGIDTDGHGFVDDVYGWDFYSNDNDPMDTGGHGTHVAGTIGAQGNNDIGIVGVMRGKPRLWRGVYLARLVDPHQACYWCNKLCHDDEARW